MTFPACHVGGLIGREDVEASLAHINLFPPAELIGAVWAKFGAPAEKVSIWKILSKLPAPRAGIKKQLSDSFAVTPQLPTPDVKEWNSH